MRRTEGFTPDLRPMVTRMCALCTHDVLPGEERVSWNNGAVAHRGEAEDVVFAQGSVARLAA